MATQTIKNGTRVEWTSQGSGFEKTKTGVVITVLKKSQNYREAIHSIPQRMFVDILRDDMGFTRKRARELYSSCDYSSLRTVLQRRYKIRFNLSEGMYRGEDHYLIEVEDNERKPYLYHPRAGETFAIVK